MPMAKSNVNSQQRVYARTRWQRTPAYGYKTTTCGAKRPRDALKHQKSRPKWTFLRTNASLAALSEDYVGWKQKQCTKLSGKQTQVHHAAWSERNAPERGLVKKPRQQMYATRQ